ncbi:MAG TPA: C69 family dipeptidase [Blastocatellia bacterium]|nr:C69 family dipeptidase [Blastocatellia bacterium]
MCDTLVASPEYTADGALWFAKNSDREPGEAQLVEHLPALSQKSARLQCTYLEIPQVLRTHEIVISRPFWMWGAEMGANEHGLAIGNEAVFTKLPYAKVGLTGMDLLRLALERSATARAALDTITGLIAEHGQGGGGGYRNRKFRYHNSFLIADPAEAWVLETAGPHWAAERVRGLRTISNALSIGKQFDLLSDTAYSFAKSQGWCRSPEDFDFARCYGDPFYSRMSGGAVRAACTLALLKKKDSKLALGDLFAALSDHAGLVPASGWRMEMPCAHSSWWPTRQAGQTTGSMVSRLSPEDSIHWLTGTSSPCLSVYKPVRLGREPMASGPQAGEGFDEESLFWRHEQLHRATIKDYVRLKSLFDDERKAMQARFVSRCEALDSRALQSCWDEHRNVIPSWVARVKGETPRGNGASGFLKYWEKQNRLDHFPVEAI